MVEFTKLDEELIEKCKNALKFYDDFPIKGVKFVDIFSVMSNPDLFESIIQYMAYPFMNAELLRDSSFENQKRYTPITKVVGIDSRGFIFGSRIASELFVPFVPARKPGKLPGDLVSCQYDLEYGTNKLEMQKDSINEDDRVLIVDDVLATGGTIQAVANMVENLGGKVSGISIFYLVKELNALDKLIKYKIRFMI